MYLSCVPRLLFWAMMVSRTLAGFCWLWQFCGVLVSFTEGCPATRIYVMFFSRIDWGCGFEKEKGKIIGLVIPSQDYMIKMIHECWYWLQSLGTCPKWRLLHFSTVKSYASPLLPYWLFEKNLCVPPTQLRCSFRVGYLRKLFGILLHERFLTFLPCVYSFISLYQLGIMDMYFIL